MLNQLLYHSASRIDIKVDVLDMRFATNWSMLHAYTSLKLFSLNLYVPMHQTHIESWFNTQAIGNGDFDDEDAPITYTPNQTITELTVLNPVGTFFHLLNESLPNLHTLRMYFETEETLTDMVHIWSNWYKNMQDKWSNNPFGSQITSIFVHFNIIEYNDTVSKCLRDILHMLSSCLLNITIYAPWTAPTSQVSHKKFSSYICVPHKLASMIIYQQVTMIDIAMSLDCVPWLQQVQYLPKLKQFRIRNCTHLTPDLLRLLCHLFEKQFIIDDPMHAAIIIDDLFPDCHFLVSIIFELEQFKEKLPFQLWYHLEPSDYCKTEFANLQEFDMYQGTNSNLKPTAYQIVFHGTQKLYNMYTALSMFLQFVAPSITTVKLQYCLDDQQWDSWSQFYQNATRWELPSMINWSRAYKNTQLILQTRSLLLPLHIKTLQTIGHFENLVELELVYNKVLGSMSVSDKSNDATLSESTSLNSSPSSTGSTLVCERVRLLKLWNFDDSESLLQVLQRLPNLEELHCLGTVSDCYATCFRRLYRYFQEATSVIESSTIYLNSTNVYPSKLILLVMQDDGKLLSNAFTSTALSWAGFAFPMLKQFIVQLNIQQSSGDGNVQSSAFHLPYLNTLWGNELQAYTVIDRHAQMLVKLPFEIVKFKTLNDVQVDVQQFSFASINEFCVQRQLYTHTIEALRLGVDTLQKWRYWFNDFSNVKHWYLNSIVHKHKRTSSPSVTTIMPHLAPALPEVEDFGILSTLHVQSVDIPFVSFTILATVMPELFIPARKLHLSVDGEHFVRNATTSITNYDQVHSISIEVEPRLSVHRQFVITNMKLLFPNLQQVLFQRIHIHSSELLSFLLPNEVSQVHFYSGMASESVLIDMYLVFKRATLYIHCPSQEKGLDEMLTQPSSFETSTLSPASDTNPNYAGMNLKSIFEAMTTKGAFSVEGTATPITSMYHIALFMVHLLPSSTSKWKKPFGFQVSCTEIPQFVQYIHEELSALQSDTAPANKKLKLFDGSSVTKHNTSNWLDSYLQNVLPITSMLPSTICLPPSANTWKVQALSLLPPSTSPVASKPSFAVPPIKITQPPIHLQQHYKHSSTCIYAMQLIYSKNNVT